MAEPGFLLRSSEHRAQASFDALIRRARAATGEDPEGYRHDFVKLAEKAELLKKVAGK